MHPRVIRNVPGSCPICRTALEPPTPTVSYPNHTARRRAHEHRPRFDPELGDVTRRLAVSAALTVPLLIFSMLEIASRVPPFSPRAMALLELAIASPVVLWGGFPFFARAWDSIVGRRLNMFTLVALGVGAAYFHGAAVALLPNAFPDALRDGDGGLPSYFAAAAAIVTLGLLGRVLDLRARAQSGAGLRAPKEIAPRAPPRILEDGKEADTLADVVAGYFVPAVLASAAIAFLVWLCVGPEPRLPHAVVNAAAVLIIACPCALGLATPMSLTVAAARGAKTGVLFKDAVAIERLGSVDTLVVDKAGAITEGKPTLASVLRLAEWDEMVILRWAASLERASEHPLASAVVQVAEEQELELDRTSDVRSIDGRGATGRVPGHSLALGTAELLQELGIDVRPCQPRAEAMRAEGQTIMLLAVDGKPAALLGVVDSVKNATPDAIRELQDEGLYVLMVTGDSRAMADRVAKRLAVDAIIAEVPPHQKVDIVRSLQADGKIVAAAGAGIDDAPALAQADVGIAMGTSTDAAMKSAAITLVKADLRSVVRARKLSRAAMRNIRQNVFFAFAYNVIGVPVAAGALYPAFGLLLSPAIVAAVMTLSSFSVVANALRLGQARL